MMLAGQATIRWARARLVTLPEIVSTSGTLGGKPRIAGRRIGVHHIVVWHEQMAMSVDQIARDYDLSPDDVRAALDYYAEHRTEINQILEDEARLVDEMRREYPSSLQTKLKAQRGES